MKFSEVSNLFLNIEKMSSRNEMSSYLSDFFKNCNEEDLQIISYLIQGRVAPFFVNSEFNYSEKSLLNLLDGYVSSIGIQFDVHKERKSSGDIGNTVLKLFESIDNKGKSLDLEHIYEILWKIVNTSGSGSVTKKGNIVLECLKKLSPLECKYFVRVVCGDLRLGLNSRTLLDVYSIAMVGDKGMRNILEHSYGVTADIGYIAKLCFQSELDRVEAIPGVPILSRLVERVGSFEEAIERLDDSFYLQPKFDGLRCQIHKWNSGDKRAKIDVVWKKYLYSKESEINLFDSKECSDTEVRLFTRNLEDVTDMFPEIVDAAKDIPIDSFILDSELIGWNYSKDNFLSYQQTMQRRRKYSVDKKMEDIPVQAFVFDLLYLNNKSLVNNDTKDRVESLNEYFKDTPKGITRAETIEEKDIEGLKNYFNKCVNKGLEGIIAKQLKGSYLPGVRNYEWIKIKKSMLGMVVDTVDMVVLGYYLGSGRRANLGVGAILGGIYNEEEDTFDAICKIGTGMSDSQLVEINKELSGIKIVNAPMNVRCYKNIYPDVWVEPKYVVTVEADEISMNISNDGNIGGGLSLRFPRLIQFGRDKSIEDITTINELLNMYQIEKRVGPKK